MVVISFALELRSIYSSRLRRDWKYAFCMIRFNALKRSWEHKSLLALIKQYFMKGPIIGDKVGLTLDVVSINLK